MKSELSKLFPKHEMRIELFFGAGGSFFNLPQSKHAILNDLDDDVTNLFLVVQNKPKKLKEYIDKMPISEGLFKHFKNNNYEINSVIKAARFLFLSNFSYLGKGDTIHFTRSNTKQSIIEKIDLVFEKLKYAKIMSKDFREVLPSITFSTQLPKDKAFVYLDPVYLDTAHNYKVQKWKKQDTVDCLDIMVNCGIKCAMSEFNHKFVVSEAKERGLNVIYIKERTNLKNKKLEILITNYDVNQLEFIF